MTNEKAAHPVVQVGRNYLVVVVVSHNIAGMENPNVNIEAMEKNPNVVCIIRATRE